MRARPSRFVIRGTQGPAILDPGRRAQRHQGRQASGGASVAERLGSKLATGAFRKKHTAPDSRLSSMTKLYHLQALISRGLAELAIDIRFTPHCPRAGWATFRHTAGQAFTDLREDGRWRTDSSLRVYLDTVSNCNVLAAPAVARQLGWFHSLAESLPSWLTL